MDGNKIGVRIMQLRDERGESQEDVAKGIGESRETVRNWEVGTRKIKAESIIKLSKHFGVSADYLLGLTDFKAVDNDMRIAAKVTGLSNDSIQWLIAHKNTTLCEGLEDYETPHSVLDMLLSGCYENEFFEDSLIQICFAMKCAKRAIDSCNDMPENETELENAYKILEREGMTILEPRWAAEYFLSDAVRLFQKALESKITDPMNSIIREKTAPTEDEMREFRAAVEEFRRSMEK